MKTPKLYRNVKFQIIKLYRRRKISLVLALLTVLLVLAAHIFLALYLATDAPGDGAIYSQIAINLLEQKIYSVDAAAPFSSTLIRLPGYPLFLAAVYSVFADGNETAVRVIQAIIHTVTCGLVAWLAWLWSPENRRRAAAWLAFLLSAACPFTLIYTATLLTETLTTFLMVAMTLTTVFAVKAKGKDAQIPFLLLTGVFAGTAVLMRPDSGLFALGIGLTLAFANFFKSSDTRENLAARFGKILWQGTIFSVAFILPLVPWTIRNEEVFQVFQPLAPTHAEAPGEFVPVGYYKWVRTWIDDQKYIAPALWDLGDKQIKVEKLPASAFDSDAEKAQVANLINQYNNSSPTPPSAPNKQKDAQNSSDKNNSADNADDSDDKDDSAGDDDKDNEADADKSADDKSGDQNQADDSDDDDSEQADDSSPLHLKITPEVDAQFAQIADQRIARAPLRYYIELPAKRAVSLWFDTHSAYFPFDGELLPLKDLDNDENQEIWLPLFAVLVWVYTFLAVIGAFFLWRDAGSRSATWLFLVVLMIFPRIIFFATLENPEPRYVVELFAFTAALGGIALSRLKFKKENGKLSVEFIYGKD